MSSSTQADGTRVGRRAATVLVAVSVAGAGLVASSTAQAAPPPNVQNAKLCLHDGWKTLKKSDGRSFRNAAQCVIYALLGGQFAPPPGGGGGE